MGGVVYYVGSHKVAECLHLEMLPTPGLGMPRSVWGGAGGLMCSGLGMPLYWWAWDALGLICMCLSCIGLGMPLHWWAWNALGTWWAWDALGTWWAWDALGTWWAWDGLHAALARMAGLGCPACLHGLGGTLGLGCLVCWVVGAPTLSMTMPLRSLS